MKLNLEYPKVRSLRCARDQHAARNASASADFDGFGAVFLLTLGLMLAVSSVHAGEVGVFGGREIRLQLSGDGAPADVFGGSLAYCDGELLIAAPSDQIPIPDNIAAVPSGSVYRYRSEAGQFRLIGKLLIPSIEQTAGFGVSMACDQNELFIGAPGVSNAIGSDAGTVFRYLRSANNWQFNGEIPENRSNSGALLGVSMALTSRYLLVGAMGENAAYLYRRNGISLSAPEKLAPAGLAFGVNFGQSVALGPSVSLSQDFAAVSAPAENAAPGAAGQVFRYQLDAQRAAVSEIGRLNGPQGFGKALSFAIAANAQNQLWVGSPLENNFVGAVSLFGAQNQQLLTLPVPRTGDLEFFGSSFATDPAEPHQVLVGAIGASQQGRAFKGAAYRFQPNAFGGYALLQSYAPAPSSSARFDQFGSVLLQIPNTLISSAPQADVGPHPGQGQVYAFEAAAVQRIDSGRGMASDRFGITLAADQQRVLTGSFLIDSAGGVETGEMIIAKRNAAGWQREATLFAPDALQEQRFGVSAAIEGDWAVVGSYWDVIAGQVDAGSVYVYQRDAIGWQFRQKLVAPLPRERALFGFSVALKNDRIAVGARGDQGGSLTFFLRDSSGRFIASDTYRLPDVAANDAFSASLALSEFRGQAIALVGAPGYRRSPALAQGRAFVYRASKGSNVWTQGEEIIDPQAGSSDFFGFALALNQANRTAGQGGAAVPLPGDLPEEITLLVGSPNSGTQAIPARGHATAFRIGASGITRIARFDGPEQPGAQCGISVALSMRADQGALVGCSGLDAQGQPASGAVLRFPPLGVGFAAEQLLFGPSEPRMALGRTVAWSGDRAMAGAPNFASDNPQEGVVFELSGDALFADGFADGIEF